MNAVAMSASVRNAGARNAGARNAGRSVMALASLGLGLVHLAIGAAALPAPAFLLIGFGIAELGWGIAVLARGTLLLPNVAPPLALAPLLLWGLDVTVAILLGVDGAAAALPFGPMAASAALSLFLGAGLAISQRRSGSPRAAASAPRPGRYLIGVTLGAMLVAGLVIPALAGTQTGAEAAPDGERGTRLVKDDAPGPHSGH